MARGKGNRGAANVIANRVQSTDEARRRGHNGGVASGKARREKRTMRQWAEALRDAPALTDHNATNAQLAILAAWQAAQAGDVPALKFLTELMGEMTGPQQPIVNEPPIVLNIHDPGYVQRERERIDRERAELAQHILEAEATVRPCAVPVSAPEPEPLPEPVPDPQPEPPTRTTARPLIIPKAFGRGRR